MVIRNTHILVVEDNADLQFGLRLALEVEGYSVTGVTRVCDAMAYLAKRRHDAIILDLMLPDGDGLDVLRHVKDSNRGVVVLVLSARTAEFDRLLCFRAGADDYVPKPFSVAELLERLRIRLGLDYRLTPIRLGEVEVDVRARRILRAGKSVPLTKHEALLFTILMKANGAMVSRETLLTKGWRFPPHTQSRTLDYFIGTLRKKIEQDPRDPVYLKTVRGQGYQLDISI